MIKGRYAHVDKDDLGEGLTKYIRALLDVYEWETMICSFAYMMQKSSAFIPLVEQVGEHAIPFIFEHADNREGENWRGLHMSDHLLLSTITEGQVPLDDKAVKVEGGWAKFSVNDVDRCWRQWAIAEGYLSEADSKLV